jgi:hypothetical protein
MTFDPTLVWIAVGAIVLLAIIFLFARGSRRSRTESLRETFGTEYNHVVKEKGRKRGEEELVTRAEEVRGIEIRPLSASESERYRGEWQKIEARFVERPTTAVVEADEMIAEIMRAQGYPIGDFERHAAHLAVNHPNVVSHYRLGHDAIDANRDGKSTTEELRQAMLHYRALVTELLGGRADLATTVPVQREIDGDRVQKIKAPENSRDEIRT